MNYCFGRYSSYYYDSNIYFPLILCLGESTEHYTKYIFVFYMPILMVFSFARMSDFFHRNAKYVGSNTHQ